MQHRRLCVSFWILIAVGLSAEDGGRGGPLPVRNTCQEDVAEIREGDSLFSAGRYAEARAKFESVLSEPKHRAHSNSETAGCLMNQIALTLQYQYRIPQAVQWFQRALGQFNGKLSPALESRITTNLAIAYSELGDLGKAEESARRAVGLAHVAFGESHAETLGSWSTLAAVHYQRGEFARAEPILRRALFVFEKALGPGDYGVAAAASSLAEVYRVQGRYGEATQLYRKALLGFENNLPRASSDIPLCLANLMMALFSGDRKHEAEELLENVLVRAEKLVGSQHPAFATVLQYAAEIHFRQKRYGPAKQLLEQALDILERFYGTDARELRRCLESYAAALRAMKDKSRAKEIDARIRILAASGQRSKGEEPYRGR